MQNYQRLKQENINKNEKSISAKPFFGKKDIKLLDITQKLDFFEQDLDTFELQLRKSAEAYPPYIPISINQYAVSLANLHQENEPYDSSIINFTATRRAFSYEKRLQTSIDQCFTAKVFTAKFHF